MSMTGVLFTEDLCIRLNRERELGLDRRETG